MKRVSLFVCIVLVIALFLVVFSGCSNKEYESGDFKYYKFGKGENAYAEITGLTEQGKTKKVLIVPKKIDGIPVNAILKPSFMHWGPPSIWDSEKLQKIYLPYNMEVDNQTFDGCPNLSKMFVIEYNAKKGFVYNGISHNNEMQIFVDKTTYESKRLIGMNPANVTYHYNFERADNDGVFWIDNMDEGALIVDVPPTEPIRERWTFGGWYTEPECINEWNFSTDTVSADGASLYAKWL